MGGGTIVQGSIFAHGRWRVVYLFILAWLMLSLPWAIVWLGMSDLGGYPLNDDPFYAKPVAWWVSEGRQQVALQSGELTASSLAHVAVGACAMWGHEFSYRWLYVACIAQQSLGTAVIYRMARWLGHNVWRAALFAGSLVSFPLYYGHAFTFMTDGPSAAWSALALTSLVCGTLLASPRWLCLGSLAVGWGYWIRQTNATLLAIPLLALLILFSLSRHRNQTGLSSSSRRFGLLAIATIGLAGASILSLESGWLLPSSYSRLPAIQPEVDTEYFHRVAIAIYGWALLLGWFSLPFCPMLIHSAYRARHDMSLGARRFCDGAALLALVLTSIPFTLSAGRACITSATGCFIQNAHFGPIFLSDMDEPGRWGELPGAEWPIEIWQLLTVASIVATASTAWWAAWNFVQLVRMWLARRIDRSGVCALSLIVITFAIGVAMPWIVEPNMDRYWLFLFPGIVLWWQLVSRSDRFLWSRWSTAWAVICMMLGLGMAVVFTHDMLAWNAARWQFINGHLSRGNTADSIDGGRDVNAWLRLDEDPATLARPGDTSAWWSGRAKTAVAAGEREHWHVIDRLSWNCWATGQTNWLLVLEHD